MSPWKTTERWHKGFEIEASTSASKCRCDVDTDDTRRLFRMTPAQAAGVTDRLREVEDIVRLEV